LSDIGTALQLEQFSNRYTGMLIVDGVDFYVRAIPPHSPAPIPALAVFDAAGAKANSCKNP
jgi:hypothetical protein